MGTQKLLKLEKETIGELKIITAKVMLKVLILIWRICFFISVRLKINDLQLI